MDKAVILARSLGTRMRKTDPDSDLSYEQRAMAETGVKAMIPIGRPFLDYVISALADAGYRRVCLIVAPDHGVLRDYYGKPGMCNRVSVEFAVQAEPRGTGDAVLAAEEFSAGDPFLVINSDNYYPAEAMRGLREIDSSGLALFERQAMIQLGNIQPERVSKFAVGLCDENGCLVRIIEKPDEETLRTLPEPIGLSMNCWRFGPSIFPACRAIEPSARGELELPDAVQRVIDGGESFRALTFRAPVLDMTSRADVASMAEKLSGVEPQL
jgi:dTDP-glucose pyrophosphorylase